MGRERNKKDDPKDHFFPSEVPIPKGIDLGELIEQVLSAKFPLDESITPEGTYERKKSN